MIDGYIRKGEKKQKIAHCNICTKLKLIEKKDCVLVDLRLETEDGTYSSRQFAVGRYAGKRIKATVPKKKALEFAKTAANKIAEKGELFKILTNPDSV